MSSHSLESCINEITAHRRGDDLSRLVSACLFDAAAKRVTDTREVVQHHAAEIGITGEEAATSLGNVLDALSASNADPSRACLLSVALARSIAIAPPKDAQETNDLVAKLVWISANFNFDAFGAINGVLGEKTDDIWRAVADLVERGDSRPAEVSSPDLIVAAATLAASDRAVAKERCADLAERVKSPLVARLLRMAPTTTGAEPLAPVTGELCRPPRSVAATLLLAVCGWLLVSHVVRLFARFALQYRRPAEIALTSRGLLVRSKTTVLGRVLRESETLIPIEGLARANREVRFPRAEVYAGLAALGLGSYVGMSWFIDGIRATSLSVAALGLLLMAVGIGIDFVLTSLLPGRAGRCRILLVPRRGPTTCLSLVDVKAADAALSAIAQR